MITSGSAFSTNFRHSKSSCRSSLNSRTCDPTMWAHVLRVKTLRTNGFDSPTLVNIVAEGHSEPYLAE